MREQLRWLRENDDDQLDWAMTYLNTRAHTLGPLDVDARSELIRKEGGYSVYQQIKNWAQKADSDPKHKKLRKQLGGAWAERKHKTAKAMRTRSLVLQESTKQDFYEFAKSHQMSADHALSCLVKNGLNQVRELEQQLLQKIEDSQKKLRGLETEISHKALAIGALNRLLRESLVDQSILQLQLDHAKSEGLSPIGLKAEKVAAASRSLLKEGLQREKEHLGSKYPSIRLLTQVADYPDEALVELRLTHQHESKPLTQRARRVDARLRRAQLAKPEASFETINRNIERELNVGLLNSIEPCTWIQYRQNMVITGLTGRGKTWMASAIGHQACKKDWAVRFYALRTLLEELEAERSRKRTGALRKELARLDLLIIDDFDLRELSNSQYQWLLEIIDDREQRRSTLITSHSQPSEWHQLVPDNEVTWMLIDRLGYADIQFRLQGESMRKRMAEAASSECVNNDQHSAPAAMQQAESLVTPSPAPSGGIDTTNSAHPATSNAEAPERTPEGHASHPEDKPNTQEAAPSTVGTEK